MNFLKKILFLITSFAIFFTLTASAETAKVMSLSYDDSASLVYINIDGQIESDVSQIKCVRLQNPNRIYFDINDAILIGAKQQLVFDKSNLKEIRLAQFSTDPNVVRVVVTFEEDFDTAKIKLINVNGNIIIKAESPSFINDYFNTIYDENPIINPYSNIVAGSQVVQKTIVNTNSGFSTQNQNKAEIMDDIYKAFSSSTLNNSDGKTYDSVISVDLSADLKLRTKYFINGYYLKNDGLLVSGLGQLTATKLFILDSPKRVVVDLPNTYVDKKIRNKDLALCPNGSCTDTAKIGQFEYNKARIVITTDKPEKYIPIYSADAQSMLLINADKLNHTSLVSSVSNIQKAFIKKLSSKSNELILSFTTPVVHSIIRNDNYVTLYLFNVKSYNEPDLIKTFSGTAFKSMTLSLLPSVGVKSELKIKKDDIIQVAQSVDGRALRLTISSQKEAKQDDNKDDKQTVIEPKKPAIKNKVVIDPGHGGTDYGAIREGINEKDITMDLSQRVAAILKSKGYKYALTRTEDIYLGLQERCDFTETENPQIFVSIHVNSAVATDPYGIETHYYHEESKELADVIQKHLIKSIDTKDRGVLKSKFYVINHTDVPAVLVETGFISNPSERAELITEKRKQATAKAIAEGIIEYLKGINKGK